MLLLLGCTSGEVAEHPDSREIVTAMERAFAGKATERDLRVLERWETDQSATFGPWKQDVTFATSMDGQTFRRGRGVVVPSAAVPEVIYGPDGTIYLYYVDGRLPELRTHAAAHDEWLGTHGMPGVGALGLATSTDGVTFTPVADFVVKGLVPGMVVDPDVVAVPGGWRMYYVGMTVRQYMLEYTWKPGEAHDIYSAFSPDLVHWTQEGVAVHGPFADPTVQCFPDDSCVMFSFGLDVSWSNDGGRTFRFGGAWNRTPGFAPEIVSLGESGYGLLYNSMREFAPLELQVSRDGRTWLPAPNPFLDGYGEAVTLLADRAGGWRMYFHDFKPGIERPHKGDKSLVWGRLPSDEEADVAGVREGQPAAAPAAAP